MGMIFAFSCALCHSISNILVRKGMSRTKNENGLAVTVFVNTAFLLILTIIYRLSGAETAPFNLKGTLLFVLAGLLTTLIGRFSFFAGIRRIGSSRAAAIKKSSPIFTLIFALVILKETIGVWPFIGICLIMIGLFIQGVQLFRDKQERISQLGYVFSLCSALSFGIGTVVRKQALLYFTDALMGALIGSITALVIIFAAEMGKGNILVRIKKLIGDGNYYYLLAGLASTFALLSSFLALLFIHAAYLGAISATESILTVMLSKLFLDKEEPLSFSIILSACLICFGACLIALTG